MERLRYAVVAGSAGAGPRWTVIAVAVRQGRRRSGCRVTCMATRSVEGRPPGARRILLVDDADVRMLMEMRLEAEGYTVVVAENGQAALDRLRDQPVDAILLDLMMPVMDGREFRRAQVRDPAIADIP